MRQTSKLKMRNIKSDSVVKWLSFSFLSIYVVFILCIILSVFVYTNSAVIFKHLISPETFFAIKLSLLTSLTTTLLALIFAIPSAYCLSRYDFKGKEILDTLIDLPIVLPPLIAGVCLLVFFSTKFGKFLENHGLRLVFTVPGIVLAQFIISASFAIRALRSVYDSIDTRYEDVARTLGCNKIQAFFKVTFPLSIGGLITGTILTWTRAVGEFVPILLFCGAQRFKTEIMPIAIFLHLEIGDIEGAVSLTIIFLIMSSISLILFKKIGLRGGLLMINK